MRVHPAFARRFSTAALLAAAAMWVWTPTTAQVTTFIPADRDNSLYELASGTASNALGENIYTGRTNSGFLRRGVIRFDIGAQVPAGATIEYVSLTMNVSKIRQAASATTSLHRVLMDWGEGTSMAGEFGGTGSGATPGDATWDHTFYDTDFWTLAGGDYVSLASASIPVELNGSYTWPTHINLVQDVQFWLDTPANNFGWIIIGNEASNGTSKRFDSRENLNGSNRPLLEVRYTVSSNIGACCAPGGCVVTSDTNCASMSGTYQGNGTTCTPDPCISSMGACCNSDGTCDERTETDCTNVGGVYQGDSSTCALAECPIELTPFVEALPIPVVATPTSGSSGGIAAYDMSMVEFQHQFHPSLPATTVWGWNDGVSGPSLPGPTVEGASGDAITVRWINDLREISNNLLRTDHYLAVDTDCIHGAENTAKTVVHLHGAHTEAEFDGYPEDTFTPGNFDTYVYGNDQLAGTLWYHDHALGITRLNVYMGLVGLYILRDPVETALNLPNGEYEIPLAIFDRKFNPDGTYDYPAMWMDHVFGDKLIVNGKVSPFLNVKQGKYRFRILNGAGSRTLSLSLNPPSGSLDFTVIGVEGGLLEAPVPGVSSLTLGPAERSDLIIDFAGYNAGDEIIMANGAPAPFPNGSLDGAVDVMKFVVTADVGDTDAIPTTLRTMERLQEGDAVLSRDFRLARGANNACGRSPWTINDLGWDDITEYPQLGSTEIWRFVNDSGISHPMHMHLVNFQILDRDTFTLGVGDEVIPGGNPQPPLPEEDGWKDTAMVGPGEILRVIARFEDFKGKFAYHCHILEHEDHDMMRQFETVLCGDTEIDTNESCDDGGTVDWDGCTSACDTEQYLALDGTTLLGGQTVSVDVDGVTVSVTTSSGQSAAQIVAGLAASINSDPTLQPLGVTAFVIGNQLLVNAELTNVVVVVGISVSRELLVFSNALWWSSTGGVGSVDVATGDLSLLDGGYPGASCLGNNLPGDTLADAAAPPVGSGYWYLVRDQPGGSWGSAARDADITTCP
ncbi:MAG: multicopper oxidase domain-containing protein [Acidobacteriota bacterium]|nr:multicopper oxidase domain-containing protein [Acidobacteriota bacterium]MDH3784657.1 multicopper oxidase domain-containing protein [Acidobacteriota bacterium]